MKGPERSLEVFGGLIQDAKTTPLKGGENPPQKQSKFKKKQRREKNPPQHEDMQGQ